MLLALAQGKSVDQMPILRRSLWFPPKKVTSVFGSTEAKVGEVFEGTKLSRTEIFKKVAWEKIKEEHPLMMCLFCPPADAYTRPQRLTVLLAGIYASLLSTAFVMSMAPPESIVEKVIAGVVTVLIVIPVNVVFTGIFSIGLGPKESTESPTVRESEIRETPWARQDRMLNERRWEKANLQEKVWLSVVGKAPSEPPDPAKVYAKVDLDKYGKNSVVDVCKCIAWVMAIFFAGHRWNDYYLQFYVHSKSKYDMDGNGMACNKSRLGDCKANWVTSSWFNSSSSR